jgi:hypothetical protein
MSGVIDICRTVPLQVSMDDDHLKGFRRALKTPETRRNLERGRRNEMLKMSRATLHQPYRSLMPGLKFHWDGHPEADDDTVIEAIATLTGRAAASGSCGLDLRNLVHGLAMIGAEQSTAPNVVACHATPWTPSTFLDLFSKTGEPMVTGEPRPAPDVAEPMMRVSVVRSGTGTTDVFDYRVIIQPVFTWSFDKSVNDPVGAMRIIADAEAAIERMKGRRP